MPGANSSRYVMAVIAFMVIFGLVLSMVATPTF